MDFIGLFEKNRANLTDQYISAWHNDKAYAKIDKLFSDMLGYSRTLKGQPHPPM